MSPLVTLTHRSLTELDCQVPGFPPLESVEERDVKYWTAELNLYIVLSIASKFLCRLKVSIGREIQTAKLGNSKQCFNLPL